MPRAVLSRHTINSTLARFVVIGGALSRQSRCPQSLNLDPLRSK